MVEVGKRYKPSDLSAEDKNTVIEVYDIRMGRVCYTEIKTQENGEIELEDFGWYYDEICRKKKKRKQKKEKRKRRLKQNHDKHI